MSSISNVDLPPFSSMFPFLALNDLALREDVPGAYGDSLRRKVSTIGATERQSFSKVEFLCRMGFKPAFSALLILLGYAVIAPTRQR